MIVLETLILCHFLCLPFFKSAKYLALFENVFTLWGISFVPDRCFIMINYIFVFRSKITTYSVLSQETSLPLTVWSTSTLHILFPSWLLCFPPKFFLTFQCLLYFYLITVILIVFLRLAFQYKIGNFRTLYDNLVAVI